MMVKNINEGIFNKIKIEDVVNITNDIMNEYITSEYKILKGDVHCQIYINKEVIFRINIFNGSIFIKDELLYILEEGYIDFSEKCKNLNEFKIKFKESIVFYYENHFDLIKYSLGFIFMVPCFDKDEYSDFIYRLYNYNNNVLDYSDRFRKYLNKDIEDKIGYLIDAKKFDLI